MEHTQSKKLPAGSKTAYPLLDHMEPEKQALRLKKVAVSAKIDWLSPMSWKRLNPHPNNRGRKQIEIMKNRITEVEYLDLPKGQKLLYAISSDGFYYFIY